MIIIWSHSGDTAANRVEQSLKTLRCPVIRLNTDEYGSRYQIRWYRGKAFIRTNNTNYSQDKIRAIYYRRPSISEIVESERDFIKHEAWYFVRAILLKIPGLFWMNHPSNILFAENKLLQLELAHEVQLSIPKTIIPVNDKEAYSFFIKNNRSCVCKPGYAGILQKPDMPTQAVYTWRIPKAYEEKDFKGVISCPTIIQEEIIKIADWRVTVVGDKYIAVRIQAKDKQILDWRTQIMKGLFYEKFELSSQIKKQIRQVMKRLKLSFAAFDFAEKLNGEPVFLELNPAGQWEWLEVEAKTEVAKTIAARLRKETL